MKSKMLSDSGETWRRVIRVPVKAALEMAWISYCGMSNRVWGIEPADKVGIASLFVGQGIEVLFDF